DERVLRSAGNEPLRAGGAQPEDTEAPELVGRERIGRAGIAPAHVPRIFEEHRLTILVLHLTREHGAVETGELVLDVLRDIHSLGQLHRAVVRRLHASVPRDRENEELLWPVG